MNYRDKFYSKYVSTQTSQLYGEVSLEDIKKQFPAWKKYFGRFLPKDKNAKILDVGCGNGSFVWWLRQIGYQNVEGIDISKEQVESASKLNIKNIFQADLREFLNNKKEVYDVIFARDVLEHFNKEEIIDVLDVIYDSLNKNGQFICQTVNAENLLWGRLRYGDFTHEMAFTRESLSQVFQVVGFKDIKVYSQPPVIHGTKSLIRFILWKCVEYCLHFYLLIETGSGKGIFTQNIIATAQK